MSLLTRLKELWSNRGSMGTKNESIDLVAFLPASLEIQETPPNPIAKWLGRSLIALFVLVVIWSIIGKVDIVSSAEGKIIPSARVKTIQPLEKAIVKRILVKEGQTVSKGEALVELDATVTLADEARLQSELMSALYSRSINKSLLILLNLDEEALLNLSLNSIELLPLSYQIKHQAILDDFTTPLPSNELLYRSLLWQKWQNFYAQLQSLKNAFIRTEAERAMTDEVISKLVQTLPIVNKRADNMKALQIKNYASENDYLGLEQERIQQTQDLAAQRQARKQISSSIKEIEEQMNALLAQTKAEQLVQLADVERQISSLVEEVVKARDLNAQKTLYAPVSGQVQQLAISTIGGVVTEAQQLMLIVPDEEKLEVEVTLNNRDIGFVRAGMPAEIKIHTFQFTKYGLINGKVTSVSSDAIIDEKQGLIYSMRVAMEQSTMMINGREVKLIPGMSVTVEVPTDKRRIIEFFLAPLLRYQQEGLRER